MNIHAIIDEQRSFFKTGQTKNIEFRIHNLKKLREAIKENEDAILAGLKNDLSKSKYEGYLTEIGIVLDEIRYALKRIKSWARPKRVRTPFVHFPASSHVYPEPYGVALIISPWNYPFQLAMAPVIGSIAAGNCCILKPSEFAPHTAAVISDMLSTHFKPEYMAAIEGDAAVSQSLLGRAFDKIFFTGSVAVGKQVMAAAAEHLTPVTLELGGKSPCIVDNEVDLHRTARRIVSGKFINAGQTCIAPDYLMVHADIKSELLKKINMELEKFFGQNPQQSPDFGRIINDRHLQRLEKLLLAGNIITGGRIDRQDRYIAPTIIEDVSWEDPIMQEEIFGPILPVLTFQDLSEVVVQINARPKPLALYIFSLNRSNCDRLNTEISFGGGCINDTLLHAANPYLPFGGVGNSGIGSYHGRASFDAFSHHKSVLKKSFRLDMPLRYPPYGNKLKWIKKVLK